MEVCNQVLLKANNYKWGFRIRILSIRCFVVASIPVMQAMLIRLVCDVYSAHEHCFFLFSSLLSVLKYQSKVLEYQLNLSCVFFGAQLKMGETVPKSHWNNRKDGKSMKRNPFTVFAHDDL